MRKRRPMGSGAVQLGGERDCNTRENRSVQLRRLRRKRLSTCARSSDDPLRECQVERHGAACILCQRCEPISAPREWSGRPGLDLGPVVNVQAIRWAPAPDRWSVVVFRSGLDVDGRFPIIGAVDRARAFALAVARARQLGGDAPVEMVLRGEGRFEWWRVGSVGVRVVDPF